MENEKSMISATDDAFSQFSAMSTMTRKESNFKVVVRVRPPLKREMPGKTEKDEFGKQLNFLPVTQISDNNRHCTLLEYLGQECTEKGRQRDIQKNPQHLTHHKFAFDQIYGPDSTQIEVYD